MTLLYFVVVFSVFSLASGCKENTDCLLSTGHVGQCHLKKCIRPLEDNNNEYLKFTIRVKYPESVLKNHGRASLYIRGNGLGLLWTKGKTLKKTDHDTWDINITYTSSLDEYQCKFCLDKDYLPDNQLQYRIMADDLQDMIGANFAIHFPVSEVSSYFETVPVFSVYPWFFTYTGVIDSFVMNSTVLGEEKIIHYQSKISRICSEVFSLASGCKENTDCLLSTGHVGQCHLMKCIRSLEDNTNEYLKFTIRVKYPESVLKNHGRASLYIRGNGLGLLWAKGKTLTKTDHDTWDINITYTSSLDGYQCKFCLDKDYLPDKKLQYRIMVDDLQNMIGANFAINLPVSEVSSYFKTVPVFSVYPWFFTYTGVIDSFVMNSTVLGEEKNITLYTPPSFNENVYKTYPTIFVLDLNLEFAYSFKKKFEEPIYPHAAADEYILIGFGDYDFAEIERVDYLTPTTGPTLSCINGTFGNRCHGCVPVALHENAQQFIRYLERDCGKYYIFRGDSTLDFLEKEAFPFANKMTSMRLQDDNIGVMGYSLGALLSCYAIWTRPDVYSFAACQSPPFWMPINSTHPNVTNFDFLTRLLKDPIFQVKRPEQKIYFDAGGAETNYPYRITQATIEAAKTITQFKHYELNRNVWIFIDPGKGHSFTQWKKRIGQALTTLLPAQGAKRMPSSNDLSVG